MDIAFYLVFPEDSAGTVPRRVIRGSRLSETDKVVSRLNSPADDERELREDVTFEIKVLRQGTVNLAVTRDDQIRPKPNQKQRLGSFTGTVSCLQVLESTFLAYLNCSCTTCCNTSQLLLNVFLKSCSSQVPEHSPQLLAVDMCKRVKTLTAADKNAAELTATSPAGCGVLCKIPSRHLPGKHALVCCASSWLQGTTT